MNITAIIPAYNEEKTIEDVLMAVKKSKVITNIIVVSDGSIDSTADKARKSGANVVELKKNVGKGGAMKAGIDVCSDDIILFLDADLIGLTPKHITDLLEPVIAEKTDMTIGLFTKGRFSTDLAQKLTPFLSGQRAIKRSIINKIPNIDVTKYGVEVALTKFFQKENIKMEIVELKDMSHFTKEEKLGFVKGFTARLKMYWDIIKCLKTEKIK